MKQVLAMTLENDPGGAMLARVSFEYNLKKLEVALLERQAQQPLSLENPGKLDMENFNCYN